MSYYFTKTLQGPAVVGEDEVVFFHEYEVLKKYIDADFFERAYEFCAKTIEEHAALLSEMILKDKMYNYKHALSLMAYWDASKDLKELEKELHRIAVNQDEDY